MGLTRVAGLWVWALALVFVACAHGARRDRGAAGLFDSAPVQKAPTESRCARFSRTSNAGKTCDEAKYLADGYVRRLATGDSLCLQETFGEPPGGTCKCRAAVVDTATNRVLVEVREAKPDSPWFGKEQTHVWFEEGALVDLYLAERGY